MARMFRVYIPDNFLSHHQLLTVSQYPKPSRGLVGTMKSARAMYPYYTLALARFRHCTYDTTPGESPRSHARDFPSPNNYLHHLLLRP